ncbi:AMP-binding protein [Sphingorhabdus sp. EL138]|uniref:AMP-binding protein n=1 Tax=Sphingorhabdus sp. EL138 TaxID=2073156 RepID=UPI0025F4A3C1|nr:AMP-binding protein [Sphingorhabdus sp. EL138]
MTDGISRHNSQSYVMGKQLPFLPMGRIGDALRQAANNWPHFEALVSVEQGIRLTWSGLDHAVDDLAAGLRALGLCPGDRVGLWAVNSAEWVIVQLATARVGMILVTINPAYRVEEFKHAVAASGCAALIVGPAYKTSNFAELTLESEPNLGSVSQQIMLPTIRVAIQFGSEITAGFLDWDEVIAAGKRNIDMLHDNEPATFNELSPVNIQFTSGTTGLPKGVTLSHQNILQNGWFTGRALGLTERDRLCIPVPLYHCFGLVTGVLACVARGATMVLPSPTFDAERTLSTLAEEACTAVYGVPTLWSANNVCGNSSVTEF